MLRLTPHFLNLIPGARDSPRLELIVPRPARRKLADQVLIQLVEADVEIGFALVDEAKGYLASGQLESSSRVLKVADGVVAEIQLRLERLGEPESWPFHPLVTELRNQIAAVQREAP